MEIWHIMCLWIPWNPHMYRAKMQSLTWRLASPTDQTWDTWRCVTLTMMSPLSFARWLLSVSQTTTRSKTNSHVTEMWISGPVSHLPNVLPTSLSVLRKGLSLSVAWVVDIYPHNANVDVSQEAMTVVVSCVLPHQGRVLWDEPTATMETGVLQLQVQRRGTAFQLIYDKLTLAFNDLNGY